MGLGEEGVEGDEKARQWEDTRGEENAEWWIMWALTVGRMIE